MKKNAIIALLVFACLSQYGLGDIQSVQAIEKTNVIITESVSKNASKPLMNIDEPTADLKTSGNIKVRGWAISQSGIKEVKVYVNDAFVANAAIGKSRPDVKNVYPGYPDADKSGYEYTINTSGLGEGRKTIKVEAIGKDGSTQTYTSNVDLTKAKPLMNMDEPTADLKTSGNIKVRGWAISQSGIKEVKVYVNDAFVANAALGTSRPDVKNVYPGYPDADKSGYEYTINASGLGEGRKTIKVEAIGKDGSTQTYTRNVDLTKTKPLMNMDEPTANLKTSGNIKVRGWAISQSGIKEVKVYVNDAFVANAAIGKSRPDVKNVYPGYPDADKSGYEYTINTSGLGEGRKTIKVEAIGKDGSTQTYTSNVDLTKVKPLMNMDEPTADLKTSGNIKVRGWAISQSGIKEVKVYVDDKFVANAALGTSRPDVKNVYPGYPGADKSGYEYIINSSGLGEGRKTIKVEAIGKDGSTQTYTRNVDLIKVKPLMNIDEPTANLKTGGNIKVRGWAISQSGIKEVKVYVDDKFVANAALGTSRPDVKNVYPGYPGADKSGYEYIINSSGLGEGRKTIKVEAIGKDGGIQEKTINITISKALIVVDPGHDYGGDGGAVATHNGVTYSETELNMQLAVKLKASLEAKGYAVVMTRQLWERPTSASARDSLKARTDLANGLKADLFISIHHDKSSNTSTTGVSTHYSSYKPGIEKDGINVGNDPNGWYSGVDIDTTPSKEAILGRDLANKIVANISSNLGYTNKLSHDHNLYVTLNTNMPAVLIENGFLSNRDEAIRSANPSNQQKLADTIANTVKEMF
ncbi:N-acetylmuramoyl-L-alanine amidase [Clostridium sp. YIM B02506]|uniref:N-acetylmuramoyl-L-alanine amidase n=1 Tax=Clostridium sp. YIM B02506 TaxID=2910680 RepID=UPI001EEED7D1|nr:N-acetylmuramoyl-L-alanine amidase [Clostridium sp. YIM B02506]